MLGGNQKREFIDDLVYNSDPAVIKGIEHKIAHLNQVYGEYMGEDGGGEEFREKVNRLERLLRLINPDRLPELYNAVKNGKINDGHHMSRSGTEQTYLEFDAIARALKDSELDPFQLIDKAIENMASEFLEVEVEIPEELEKEVKEAMARNTCSDEDHKSGKRPRRPSRASGKMDHILEWLNNLPKTTEKVSKYMQMTKISDLQKASSVELAKPKSLLMKKIVNKEIWFKGKTTAKRRFDVITDFSGSMSSYIGERNFVLDEIHEACSRIKADLNHTFFNSDLNQKTEVKVTSKEVLTQIKDTYPDGEDNLGRATLTKLNLMKKSKTKQYLAAISDGTGSIGSTNRSEEIKRLAKEKNIEVRFILFSNQNDMGSIPKDWIFYTY